MGEHNKEHSDLEEKLIQLEAKLMEQEHRPWALWWNFIRRKDKWTKDDPRKKAAGKAIIWRFFASPTTMALIGGGLLTFATVYYLREQNKKLDFQNDLIELQNDRIEQQTHLLEGSRRSSQLFVLSEVLSDLNREIEDPANSERTISRSLMSRIVSLSKIMRPYRYFEGNKLIDSPISPERGQLFLSLYYSEIDENNFGTTLLQRCNFRFSDLSDLQFSKDLRNFNLSNSRITGSLFINTNVNSVQFSEANMTESTFVDTTFESTYFGLANLARSQLIGCDFIGGSLNYANLNDATLRKTTFNRTTMHEVNLRGTKVDRPDWISYIKDSLDLPGSEQIAEKYKLVKHPPIIFNDTIPLWKIVVKNDVKSKS